MTTNVLLASQQVRNVDGAGGLGDVATALAKQLTSSGGHEVRLIMPGFTTISGTRDFPELETRFTAAEPVVKQMPVPLGDWIYPVDVFAVTVPQTDLTCYLLRCEGFDEQRRDEGLSAFDAQNRPNKNTAPRAILFSRAVVEFVRSYTPWRPDVIHSNDWNTGLIPVLLRTVFRNDPYLSRIATLFTTHNAGGDAYQGGFAERDYYRMHLGREGRHEGLLYLSGLQAFDVFHGGTRSLLHNYRFNFTKGGFGFADLINTVSCGYRAELLTPAFAGGLDGLLTERADDFAGIVNGLDTDEWNPAANKHLKNAGKQVAYRADDGAEKIRAKKLALRKALRKWKVPPKNPRHAEGDHPFQNLRDDSILLGVVSRIDYQKAPILLGPIQNVGDHVPSRADDKAWRAANGVENPLEQIAAGNADVQIVVLGNANDPYGSRFVELLDDMRLAENTNIMFFDGFDVPLSHLIFAASEVFLQPSMFEPCGLTQLVAMCYGTVPVVRSTGGLRETVIDHAEPNRAAEATGFQFLEDRPPNHMVNLATAPAAFRKRVNEALEVRRNDPARWNQLIENGMRRDASWTIPARQYARLYAEALRRNMRRTFFGLTPTGAPPIAAPAPDGNR